MILDAASGWRDRPGGLCRWCRVSRRRFLRSGRATDPPPRVLCPIWKNPYMSINQDTFVHSILGSAGGQNVFEEHPERYPKFTLDEVVLKQPEIIILPTEPYRFTEEDKTDFETL